MTDPTRARSDLTTFEALRAELTALAYRMLGDVGRAQDIVQDAWLRWHHRSAEVESPKAFLVAIVTRLCLNELDSARARREARRADRLPEPVDLRDVGLDRLETAEQVSMAFLFVLERLSPQERAAFLLHDVFDFSHDEIAKLLGTNSAHCRKLLERAKDRIAAGRRMMTATRAEHERLLDGFLGAVWSGDPTKLVELLAADAVIVTDGGPSGRSVGRIRNLQRPLQGAERVASFVMATAQTADLDLERRDLNGRPGIVFYRGDAPFAALALAVADGKVACIFFHGDVTRLGHLGRRDLRGVSGGA